jgi:hypothetical protein
LTALQPAVALPGDAVTVLGNGGYVHLAASGVSKLLQTFDLLLDGRPIGELSCADDHCQGSFVVPVDLPLGSHVVEAEGGSQLTLTVVVT